MKIELDFLNKVLVKEFYRLNSGFFLLVGTLAFGFMSGVEHKALAEYFVSAPRLLMIPVGVWILYALKVLSFNDRQVYLQENRLLFNIPFLPRGSQWFATTICFSVQYLPALLYGIFLCITAWRATAYHSIILIIPVLTACCLGSTAIMISKFHHPSRGKRISAAKTFLDRSYCKPAFQFYTEWLLRKHALAVVGIKIFCSVLIWSICQLYASGIYDWRLIAMGLSVCSIANLPLAFHLVRFEHVDISWIKNLPLPLTKRYFNLMVVLIILLIPESVILLNYYPAHLGIHLMVMTLIFAISSGALLLGFIHIQSFGLEATTKKSFWIFITTIILILFKLPLILLCTVNFTAGYILFKRNYYSFHPYRGE